MDGANTTTGGGSSGGAGEIMLFGFRVVVDSMRKSVSLNNLSQYVQPQDLAKTKEKEKGIKDDVPCVVATAAACGGGGDGYVSADDAVPPSSSNRTERKRGVPWTEEEHKLFLLGLQKVGKGDWRGISRNFVKTRTPTQVASHAQKYFLRRTNLNRRRRRTSLFDITTDSVTAVSMDDEQNHNQGNNINHPPESQPLRFSPSPENSSTTSFTFMPSFSIASTPVVLPVPVGNPMENLSLAQKASQGLNLPTSLTHPIPVNPAPQPSATCNLNLDLNSSADPSLLSLRLSLPSDQNERHSSAFHGMSSFSNNDGIITVA